MIKSSEYIISITDLEKRYRNSLESALSGISFSIPRGEIFGLLGPNSAGKTTALLIMCGILDYDNGSVFINGVDLSSGSHLSIIRRMTGFVTQDISLYPPLTVKENLTFFGKMAGLSGSTLKNRLEEIIEILALSEFSDKKISLCSGGIKRRVNFGAGIIHKPSILFLDEPAAGMDVKSRGVIYRYIRELKKEGATVIYTTHYMEEAEELCDRVVILNKGRVISDLPVPELSIRFPDCKNLNQVFLKLNEQFE